jgi:GNAT superfamily N-acetyltransferase
MPFAHRLATTDDVPRLSRLMNAAIRALLAPFLSADQVEASFAVMGLDRQLIDDGTYFLVEEADRLAGCGGWSRRATLFGGDHTSGRDARLLDPAREPARVRAMYTDPAFARRGVGRLVLSLCEHAAAQEGFRCTELAATMAGVPLYRASGYDEIERIGTRTPSGVVVPMVRMGKSLTRA